MRHAVQMQIKPSPQRRPQRGSVEMTSNTFRRVQVGFTAAAVAASVLLLTAGSADAYQSDYTAASRGANAPNVMKPFIGRTGYTDLRTFRAATATTKGHNGTEFKAACGRAVVATHPGVVEVVTTAKWAGPNLVKVISNSDGVATWYGFMSAAKVTTGQIVTSGQVIGTVGNLGRANGCQLRYEVRNNNAQVNPTTWLSNNVGKPIPGGRLLGNSGFTLISFNVLGASHTAARFATYEQRMPEIVDQWNKIGADVIGVQEMQRIQRADFYKRMKSAYTFYPFDGGTDTDNSILWRQATFQFVQGGTFKVPYFNGNLRNMPWALLKEKATGRTAYFLNVHNPATLDRVGDQSQWRRKAIAIEREMVAIFKATGRPVFLTGDFNDKAAAFCPLTGDGLMVASSGGDGAKCVLPYQASIDWVFGAGRIAFSVHIKDKTPMTLGLSDHPMVITRAHMAD